MSVVEVPKKWEHEADVIIVGGGTAGLPAAIVVAEAGLEATILEAMPACGGSFNMLAGGICVAATDEQKEAGIDDSPDLLCEDEVNVAGAVPELARAYADNQLEAYRMLKEEGIKFPGINQYPGHSRRRNLKLPIGPGNIMTKAFESRAKRMGVEILFRHRATRLITDPRTGKVIGIKVNVKGETKNFKAKRAVILATGGFGQNRELIAEYAPAMLDAVPKMPVSHQGDGLKMGLAVGAATKDIGIAVAPSWPLCIETHSNAIWTLDYGGIMVNVYGKRFHDESSSEGFYGFMTATAMKQPGGSYWIIYNDKVQDEMTRDAAKTQVTSIEKCKKYKANTLEELAEMTGIDAKGLKETIDKYNSDIGSAGYDAAFGRKAQLGLERPLVKIDTPAFYAIKCVTGTTSMKGGLNINGRSQVLNQYGEVIPGLYAAGEVTGGLHTKTYLLGVMAGASMTFGIIAGRNAAKEAA